MWALLVSTAFIVGFIVGAMKAEYRIWQARKDETKYYWVCPKGNYHFSAYSNHRAVVDAMQKVHEETCDRE